MYADLFCKEQRRHWWPFALYKPLLSLLGMDLNMDAAVPFLAPLCLRSLFRCSSSVELGKIAGTFFQMTSQVRWPPFQQLIWINLNLLRLDYELFGCPCCTLSIDVSVQLSLEVTSSWDVWNALHKILLWSSPSSLSLLISQLWNS